MEAHKLIDTIKKEVFVWHDKQWKPDNEFHQHHKAQLIFVEEGYQYLHTENRQFLLPQNHIAWIPSNAIHKTSSNSKHIFLRTLYFDATNLPSFYDEFYLFAIPSVLKEMILYTEKWSLNMTYNSSEYFFLNAIISELPSFVCNAIPLQIPIPKHPNLLLLTNHIHQNYSSHFKIIDLAMLCHLSIRTLERQFKKETGISIVKYIQLVKIIKSIELLNSSELSITEIATQVGYSSAQSYSNIFTKLIGTRPSEFLKPNTN